MSSSSLPPASHNRTETNASHTNDADNTMQEHDRASYPCPPTPRTQRNRKYGHTKSVKPAQQETPPHGQSSQHTQARSQGRAQGQQQSRQRLPPPHRAQSFQEEATAEGQATTVACGEIGLLPPDGVHLILPQVGKICWKVGPHYREPKHNWVEPWPDVDKVRHVLHPYFDATAKLYVQPLGEGSWNRSWTITVLSDGPVPWSSEATNAMVETTSKMELNSTKENRRDDNNGVPCDGVSLGGSNGGSSEHKFVMRIASPVYPWFKVEAEVATMEYVRRHSVTIPVPRVFLYDSSSTSQSNALGYEWILMEYVPGVEFHKTARDMTLHQKLRLAQTVADWENELSQLRFPAIGSIYFTKSVTKEAVVSAVLGLGSLPHSWRLCEHDPDFCVGPAVMQEFLGDWRLSYPFFKGPFGNEGELARSLVACRKFEASDPLQSIHSKLDAYLIVLDKLQEHAKKLRQHQKQQDCPPSPAVATMNQGQSDELAQIRDDITAAEAAICRLRACAADEASTRGLPIVHVDIQGTSRFPIAEDEQLSVFELQHPRHDENQLDESAAASEIMGQLVNKIWPPKQTKTPFAGLTMTTPDIPSSDLSHAMTARLLTPPHEDTEQSYLDTTEYTIHHWDISSHNVLIDPAMGKPVALLDWEQIYTTSALIRGYDWYPTLMARPWDYTGSEGQETVRQQELETRKMRKAFLARLWTMESPLLNGFIKLCPHISDRLHANHESHENAEGGQGENDDSDEACSCDDSDSDSDECSDDEESQPPARLNNSQGMEAAGVNSAKQLDRARWAVAVGVLAEAYDDKYFRHNSQSLLNRALKYFG